MLCLLITLLPACSGVRQVSNSGFGGFEADIEVLDANTVAIAWYDTRHPRAEIYLRLLDPKLRPISPEFRLTTNDLDSYEVNIVALDESIAATWYEIDDAQHSVVKLGLWNRQGQPLWLRTLSKSSVDARIPVIESKGNTLFVAWLETPINKTPASSATAIIGTWYDATGAQYSTPFEIAPASPTTWNLNIELASTEQATTVFIAYDSQHETLASELYLARVSDNDISVNRLTDDDACPSKYPDIALKQNQLALTWLDQRLGNNEVYITVQTISKLLSPSIPETLELIAQRISHSASDSIGAYISWNGSSLGLAWSDGDAIKENHDIYFQRLDANGTPTSKIQRLTKSQADSLIPSITSYKSGFALGWNELTVKAHDLGSRQSRSEIAVTLTD